MKRDKKPQYLKEQLQLLLHTITYSTAPVRITPSTSSKGISKKNTNKVFY